MWSPDQVKDDQLIQMETPLNSDLAKDRGFYVGLKTQVFIDDQNTQITPLGALFNNGNNSADPLRRAAITTKACSRARGLVSLTELQSFLTRILEGRILVKR